MLNIIKQNFKLKNAIILSLTLHCILIVILALSTIYYLQEIRTVKYSSTIDAVMVNLNDVVQQHNYNHQQHIKRVKPIVKQQDKSISKVVGSQHSNQQKQTASITPYGQSQKKRAVSTANEKKKSVSRSNSKQVSDVNDLLKSLIDTKNISKTSSASNIMENKHSYDINNEVNVYKEMVRHAIGNKFYNVASFRGKICDLNIKLAPNGVLISVNTVGGDSALCQAAISAAKLATIPQPPNLQVYEFFKNATIRFSPQ